MTTNTKTLGSMLITCLLWPRKDTNWVNGIVWQDEWLKNQNSNSTSVALVFELSPQKAFVYIVWTIYLLICRKDIEDTHQLSTKFTSLGQSITVAEPHHAHPCLGQKIGFRDWIIESFRLACDEQQQQRQKHEPQHIHRDSPCPATNWWMAHAG